jgi:hypothetical protein
MSRSFVLGAALALLSLSFFAPSVRADDPGYVSIDEMLKKRGSAPAFVVVVAKDDTDMAKAVLKILSDPKLAKPIKDGLIASRIDPADEAAAKQLNIPVEKSECVLALDGYAIANGKHAKTPNADTLVGLLKKAQDATKKKKDTEKKLDPAIAKAESAAKGGDTKSACEQILAITGLKDTIPCPSIEKAQKVQDDLQGKGMAILTKAKAAVDKKDFSTAHKLLSDAMNNYPLPAVLEEAKNVSTALGQAEKTASGK